jgi:formylglycine-generating enzyme required for sulfatase activity
MPALSQQPAEMVSVPAGEFWMASEDSDAFPHEKPRRRVYVDAFRIDKYEVTNALYGRFMDATGRARRNIGTTASGTSPAYRSSESIGTMQMHIVSGPGSDCRRKRSARKPPAERTEGNIPGVNNGIQAGRIHMRA